MKITIIGTGYVGLVTGACFANLGNRVYCVDSDPKKVISLKKGKITIYEPGLAEMVKRNIKEGRISFSTNIKDSIKKSEIIFICVGTPARKNGEADLSNIEKVCHEIARHMQSYKLIVEKSTVPVKTGEWVKDTIRFLKKKRVDFDIACNPEFLREGSAIKDFMHPDRIVVGVETEKAKRLMTKLYKPLNAPIIITDIKGAEIVKHASNAFLATKISFINEISNICERTGADVVEVAKGIGMDKRINESFFNAGIGFGGSCFPKDVAAFIHICKKLGYDFKLLKNVGDINEQQKVVFFNKIHASLGGVKGKTIGVLGLSFKPDTDDIRSAPSLGIIKRLLDEKAFVKVYDPQAMENTKKEIKNKKLRFCSDPYAVAKGSDCLAVVTEWDEFKKLNFKKLKRLLKRSIIVDGRNMYDPRRMKKMGFVYIGMGRRI
ncbi:MAG: UDP-glucose/GDP-mannose dehydrogenase family protein [Candidatus Omnitrophica bacterium]|nr:UDP-glucose/GDP-mannose dehydrogenase family protein [Candidatus Omnitrophota bacterium]